MKGSECKLIEYMDGSKKRFIIPVYQRNYDWKIEHCKQLYDDLVKVIKNNRKSHFFGSLVSVYESSGRNTEFLVIDGQQRLTTVSLLLLAMYNIISNGILIPNESSLARQIYEDFLVDKYQPAEARIKLKPVKDDQTALEMLFYNNRERVLASNLTINYNYFYDRIQKQEITIDELFEAICKLEIINITLNSDDNPQLIFESLNSTGLELSEGDKIRNYILMGLPSKEQDEYYEKYWNRIEKCVQYDVSSFIRDYLSVKQSSISSQKKIYTSFKEYVAENDFETEKLLNDMLMYAKRYEVLLVGGTQSSALNACILRLNRLETTVVRPFFLEVIRLWDEQAIDVSQVEEIFSITENYLFRRAICDIPTNALNKIFLALHREIVKYDGSEKNYVDKFKFALLSKKDRARFPNDSEFISQFSERQIYQMNSKNKIYILERFENYGTIEDKDVYRHCDDGTYSVEHIMPQHLTPSWIKDLGDDYENIHDKWLHRIANLTLTAYNSKYSNSSFEDKKNMRNGFADSGIRMNTYIAQMNKWTLAELEARDQYLMDRAKKIWYMPTTNYQPIEKQLESCTLDDDVALGGRLIAKFSYKNIEQPVDSWVEMFERVLRILHAEDKSILTQLVLSPDSSVDLTQYVSNSEKKLRKPIKIDEDIYIEGNTNTVLKISLLKKIFRLFSADFNDLVFYLRNEDEQTEQTSRYELRKKYWTYALDYIRRSNGAVFDNVNPTKENWINGFLGVRGANLCCVANLDSVRIELYIGGKNKEENKRLFDGIAVHKKMVEEQLGVKLNWNRGDDVKSSKIYYQLDGIGIENETNWAQAANFHAEWCKKFYDVFTPLLINL